MLLAVNVFLFVMNRAEVLVASPAEQIAGIIILWKKQNKNKNKHFCMLLWSINHNINIYFRTQRAFWESNKFFSVGIPKVYINHATNPEWKASCDWHSVVTSYNDMSLTNWNCWSRWLSLTINTMYCSNILPVECCMQNVPFCESRSHMYPL